MSILITGGSGFIGSNLDGDIKLSSKDCDLKNYDETIECFREHSPEIILNCAAHHGNYQSMFKNPVEMFTQNMLININVMRAAKEVGVKKLLSYSSVTGFPSEFDEPYTEADLHKGEPHFQSYGYAFSKRMVDVLVRSYREQYGLDYVCIILSNIYGPKNDFDLQSATVVSKLIKMCYIAKKNNTNLIVYGDGSPVRDFLYVDDVNMLTKRVIENFDDSVWDGGNGSIIFSNGVQSTIKDVVECIVESFEFKGNVVWDIKGPIGQSVKVSNNSKLISLYPDVKFTDLSVGIFNTISWFLENES